MAMETTDNPAVEETPTPTAEPAGAAPTPNPTPTNRNEIHRHFARTLHKLLLASLGAAALAQDELEDFVKKLVERGEIAEKDGRQMMNEIIEKRKKAVEKINWKAEDRPIHKRIHHILDRMNVPSKADMDALSEKITALNQKIDDLKKE